MLLLLIGWPDTSLKKRTVAATSCSPTSNLKPWFYLAARRDSTGPRVTLAGEAVFGSFRVRGDSPPHQVLPDG